MSDCVYGGPCCYHAYESPTGEWVEECCKCEEYRDEDA